MRASLVWARHQRADSYKEAAIILTHRTHPRPGSRTWTRFEYAIDDGSKRGPSADERRPLILIVDDEPDSLEALEAILQFEGFEVLTASGGAKALALCRKRRPDLAVVDWMMPGMTGRELCQLLRCEASSSDIPIIVYTGYDVPPYSSVGLYDAVFQKPAEPEHLVTAIRSLLERGRRT